VSFHADIEQKVEQVLAHYEGRLDALYRILKAKTLQDESGRTVKQFVKETFQVDFDEDDRQLETETNQKYYHFIFMLHNALLFYQDHQSNLADILSLQEAASLWGLDDSTLRKAIAAGKFWEEEYRKTGRNYIVTRAAMQRVYGVPKADT
jgi:hypothetical protein